MCGSLLYFSLNRFNVVGWSIWFESLQGEILSKEKIGKRKREGTSKSEKKRGLDRQKERSRERERVRV